MTMEHGTGTTELDALIAAMVELDEDATLAIAGEICAGGRHSTPAVLRACQQAMRIIGERYERQEYYLAGLILAGELFNQVLEMVRPDAENQAMEVPEKTILLGTVRKDIHDIGKNLFASSLRGTGFRVIDLGVDVPADRFLSAALDVKPDVLCLSGLITAAFHSMKDTTHLIRSSENELLRRMPIVLGGGTIDAKVCRYAGADSWSNDAMEGVRICQRLSRETRRDPGASG